MLTWEILSGYIIHYDPITGKLIARGKRTKELKQKIDRYGYLRIQFKNIQLRVHSIIGVFMFGALKEGMCINHIDGNKTNNKLSNLEYISRGDNIKHAYKIGLMPVKEPRDPNYNKNHYQKNKEYIKARVKKYRIENNEAIKLKKKEWYLTNKGKKNDNK